MLDIKTFLTISCVTSRIASYNSWNDYQNVSTKHGRESRDFALHSRLKIGIKNVAIV